jgi:hypothetical protein
MDGLHSIVIRSEVDGEFYYYFSHNKCTPASKEINSIKINKKTVLVNTMTKTINKPNNDPYSSNMETDDFNRIADTTMDIDEKEDRNRLLSFDEDDDDDDDDDDVEMGLNITLTSAAVEVAGPIIVQENQTATEPSRSRLCCHHPNPTNSMGLRADESSRPLLAEGGGFSPNPLEYFQGATKSTHEESAKGPADPPPVTNAISVIQSSSPPPPTTTTTTTSASNNCWPPVRTSYKSDLRHNNNNNNKSLKDYDPYWTNDYSLPENNPCTTAKGDNRLGASHCTSENVFGGDPNQVNAWTSGGMEFQYGMKTQSDDSGSAKMGGFGTIIPKVDGMNMKMDDDGLLRCDTDWGSICDAMGWLSLDDDDPLPSDEKIGIKSVKRDDTWPISTQPQKRPLTYTDCSNTDATPPAKSNGNDSAQTLCSVQVPSPSSSEGSYPRISATKNESSPQANHPKGKSFHREVIQRSKSSSSPPMSYASAAKSNTSIDNKNNTVVQPPFGQRPSPISVAEFPKLNPKESKAAESSAQPHAFPVQTAPKRRGGQKPKRNTGKTRKKLQKYAFPFNIENNNNIKGGEQQLQSSAPSRSPKAKESAGCDLLKEDVAKILKNELRGAQKYKPEFGLQASKVPDLKKQQQRPQQTLSKNESDPKRKSNELCFIIDNTNRDMMKFFTLLQSNLQRFWEIFSEATKGSDREFKASIVTPDCFSGFTSDQDMFCSFVCDHTQMKESVVNDETYLPGVVGLTKAIYRSREIEWGVSSNRHIYIFTNLASFESQEEQVKLALAKRLSALVGCLPPLAKISVGSWLKDNVPLLRALDCRERSYATFPLLSVKGMASSSIDDKSLLEALYSSSKVQPNNPQKVRIDTENSIAPTTERVAIFPIEGFSRGTIFQCKEPETLRDILLNANPEITSRSCWIHISKTMPCESISESTSLKLNSNITAFGEICYEDYYQKEHIFTASKLDIIEKSQKSISSREGFSRQTYISAVARFLAKTYNSQHRPFHCLKIQFVPGSVVLGSGNSGDEAVLYTEPKFAALSDMKEFCSPNGQWNEEEESNESLLRFCQMCFKLSGGDFMVVGLKGIICDEEIILTTPTFLSRRCSDNPISQCNKEYINSCRKQTKLLMETYGWNIKAMANDPVKKVESRATSETQAPKANASVQKTYIPDTAEVPKTVSRVDVEKTEEHHLWHLIRYNYFRSLPFFNNKSDNIKRKFRGGQAKNI